MRFWVAAAFAASALAAASANAAPPPATAFGRIPAVVQAAISPDGEHVAILGGAADQRFVSIATIDKPGLPTLGLGDVEGVDLKWAGDSYVLARVALWFQPEPRVAYRMERSVSIDLSAHAVSRMLDKGDAASNWLTAHPVLGVVRGPPAKVIMEGLTESTGATVAMDTHIARKGADEPFVLAVFSVDPATGRGALVERGTFDTEGWDIDATGEPRVRVDVDEKTSQFTLFARAKSGSQYKPMFSGPFASRRDYLGYSAREQAIYLSSEKGIVRRKLLDGAEEVIAPPGHGVTSLIWDPEGSEPVGLSTGPAGHIQWFDPQFEAVYGGLGKALKAQVLELKSWSADHKRFVVRAAGRGAPGVWYLFDSDRKELSPLGEEYPDLQGARLGETRKITYQATDGLSISAYLTLPPRGGSAGKAPLIVLPHGGPAEHDGEDFDYLAQFLATRGYAVLQPQFRGSTGFGRSFEEAGRGEWGGKMQTDLIDGIAAVSKLPEVEAGRACVVGVSFGGYAALAGVAFHPQSYRCAASIAGISDLGALLTEQGRTYGRESAALAELRQDLGANREKLVAQSPAKHVESINAPVLLIHGDKDTVVPPEQSQIMADAMKAAGKPVELIVLKNENHYLTKAATRTQALEALEAFLAKNLPVSP